VVEPDWIPSHLSQEARRRVLELTKESPPVTTIECTESLIRHWCEATEDGNPLYLDADFARSQGFAGIVAPPAINTTMSIPYRWPHEPTTEQGTSVHYELKRLLNLPVGVVVDIETEYFRFIELGDRLSISHRLASMSPPKKTRMGAGYFWVFESTARNQRGQLVSRSQMTMFATNPDGRPVDANDSPAGLSRATEEELDVERCSHLPPNQLYWDEVAEGDVLPTLCMPITVTRCVYLASATRDFSPHHSNRDYAQRSVGARDMFLNTPFNTGMLSRFATEWGGPLSRLRKVKLSMRENICAGDDMVIDGCITRRHSEGEDHLVDLAIQVSTQNGPAYEASVTLSLPQSR
jgi:acyl dehydratase